MKSFACLSLLSIALVGSVRFRVGNHHHYNFQQLATPKLEIVFPPSGSRNPSKCESYERIGAFEADGCKQACILTGGLGDVQLSRSVRHPDGFCKPAGQLCMIRAEDRVRLNATGHFGVCSKDCECLPASEHERRHLDDDALDSFLSSESIPIEVKTPRDLKKLSFEVKLSPIEWRFQDKCERFERANEHESSDSGNFNEECKVSCRVAGQIGSVEFDLPSRTLNKNKPDGAQCHLNVHRTSDVVVIGAKQSVKGKCRAGFCVTEDAQILQNRIISTLTSTPMTTIPHAAPQAQPMTTRSPGTYEYVNA